MHCVTVFVDVLHSIAFNCVHCGVFFLPRKTAWQLVNRKADFFTNRIDSNRELECSTNSVAIRPVALSCRNKPQDERQFISQPLYNLDSINGTETTTVQLIAPGARNYHALFTPPTRQNWRLSLRWEVWLWNCELVRRQSAAIVRGSV